MNTEWLESISGLNSEWPENAPKNRFHSFALFGEGMWVLQST